MNQNDKPKHVEVTRYYRPKNVDVHPLVIFGDIMSDRGVTVLYKLDYENSTFEANWSICNGDNFSKVTGIQYAQSCKKPIIGKLNRGIPLISDLIDAVEIMISDFYWPLEAELEDMGLMKCKRHEDDEPSVLENWV